MRVAEDSRKWIVFAVGRKNKENASVLLLRVWVPLKFVLLPLLEAQKKKKRKCEYNKKEL
jgi:hypothetical protein